MRPASRILRAAWRLAPLLAPAGAAVAQAHPEGQAAWSVSAQAIPLATRVSPAMDGRSYTEGYLTQPMLMAGARPWGGALELAGMLNLEGLTLGRGELNPGVWGEGYVDRRHPHTYLHEAMVTARLPERGPLAASLSVGRGFVPFGTDDPMARPFVKYPANHHLAQILERTVAVGAVRAGPVVLEGAAFNGDEPASPESLPSLRRIGDSWASRLTVLPRAGVELQGSYARVASPEVAIGGGLDQRKRSASLRLTRERPAGGAYLLMEWASTEEVDDGQSAIRYGTLLGEGQLRRGAWWVALRLERTDRPEEERLLDPFRTPRPHADLHYLGITRWSSVTLAAARESGVGPLRVSPFVEVSLLGARERVRPSFFVPAEVYGSDRIWSLSLGARLGVGAHHARVGRYGAARADIQPTHPDHSHP